jgi:hypothetical protein
MSSSPTPKKTIIINRPPAPKSNSPLNANSPPKPFVVNKPANPHGSYGASWAQLQQATNANIFHQQSSGSYVSNSSLFYSSGTGNSQSIPVPHQQIPVPNAIPPQPELPAVHLLNMTIMRFLVNCPFTKNDVIVRGEDEIIFPSIMTEFPEDAIVETSGKNLIIRIPSLSTDEALKEFISVCEVTDNCTISNRSIVFTNWLKPFPDGTRVFEQDSDLIIKISDTLSSVSDGDDNSMHSPPTDFTSFISVPPIENEDLPTFIPPDMAAVLSALQEVQNRNGNVPAAMEKMLADLEKRLFP